MKPHKALKHLFIPHEGNEYKPHFFRELSIAIILSGSVFLLGFSAGSSYFINKTVLGASIGASVLVDLTNQSRLAYNEAPLVRNPILDDAAQMKAADMVREGYFSHDSPTGVTPWHWFTQAGYRFLYAGENLAINFTDADAVTQAWLDSPKHRENLLDVKFKEIGMAATEGIYNGNPTIFIVQLFGTPAKAKAEVKEISEDKQPETPAPATVPITTENTNSPRTSSSLLKEPKSLAVATTSEVKGESLREVPTIVALVTTNEFAVVQNTDTVEMEAEVATQSTVPTYSTWYQKIIYSAPVYVTLFYFLFALFIVGALATMVVIEARKQHYKHIVYGLLLLVATLALIYINSNLSYL